MCSYFYKQCLVLLFFVPLILLECQNAGAQDFAEPCPLSVVSATRYAKPMCFAAENISLITAEDIERMNARTVTEALDTVTGIFNVWNKDFTSTSMVHIQGSMQHHVPVFIDGVKWNFLSSKSAEISPIPVDIIDRIEIVKGPASSSWGSSLGGVINIITRKVKYAEEHRGSARLSYGEGNSQDYRFQLEGMIGNVRHYFYGGRQDSDGVRESRYYKNTSFYSKFYIPVSDNTDVRLTAGYSEPHMKVGDFPGWDFTSKWLHFTFFTTASLSTSLAKDFHLDFTLHHLRQKGIQMNDVLGLPGELYSEAVSDDETIGGSCSLFWKKDMHNIVFGTDFDRGKLSQSFKTGSFLQVMGSQATASSDHDPETWAVYVNDTVNIKLLSITAGIRYDYDNINGSFTSPSLGLTYLLGASILRASVAKGFNTPHLSSAIGGLFLDPNPYIDSEEVWSYQAGIESKPFRNTWLKATLFHHDLDNALKREMPEDPSVSNDQYANKGKIRTRGFEVETEIYPFYNFSAGAGFAYVRGTPSDDQNDPAERYACNIRISYDDEKSLSVRVFGHYVNWDTDDFYEAEYDDLIWDININKKIYGRDKKVLEIFLKAHNIFSGSQYTQTNAKNPQRWIETGIRFKF